MNDAPPFQADLEGESFTVLWRERLSLIPSTFGRLLYLSSLRDPNNGRYSERILLERFGEQEADRVLRESHVLAFSQWLGYTLEQQKIDLVLYVSALRDNKRTVLRTWLRLEPYRNLIPESAGEEERKLYLCDLETVLQLLNAQFEPESCPARILVVDDNPMILGLFTRILEQAGYLVTAVNGGGKPCERRGCSRLKS